jgi:ParB family transcriptional regulator, chromosome partitioning protein
MDATHLEVDLHLLELRFAGVRLIEPQAVEKLARSIERDGQIVPCVVVRASPDSSDAKDGERLVLIDGYRRVAALRRLGRDRAFVERGRVTWRKPFWVCWHARKTGPSPRSKKHCCSAR